ncbi:MAG: response regulator [Acidobacteriota bacterium]|nr:response regulator [Acidobacteriota bacterium]
MRKTRRILVVDDDAAILEVTRTILTGAGYEVATASSGADALAAVRQTRFDVALLDINMPGMDGWETLRILQSDSESAGLPVVMFSIKSEIRDKVHGIQEGAVGYITKPFEMEGLLAGVRRVLDTLEGGNLQDVMP